METVAETVALSGIAPGISPGIAPGLAPGISIDPILRGQLEVAQPRRGPRVTTDPLLLVHFVLRTVGLSPRRVCDLGAGSGVLGLSLARLEPRVVVTGVEVQPDLAMLANQNAHRNGLGDRVACICKDLRTIERDPDQEGYDLVVANPPFHPAETSDAPRRLSRRVAHQDPGDVLSGMITAASRLLGSRGHLALVLSTERLGELCTLLALRSFALRGLRFVHGRPGAPSRRMLVLARLHTRMTPTIYPPLYLHGTEGHRFTGEVSTFLR